MLRAWGTETVAALLPDAARPCAHPQLSLQRLGAPPRAAGAPSSSPPPPLLVYLPGADGTGLAITPQLPGLMALGFEVQALSIPLEDRSDWAALTAGAAAALRTALDARARPGRSRPRAFIIAESFGGCLALRLAASAPELVARLVLVNPATCFGRAYAGLPGLVAATGLLSAFPRPLYQVRFRARAAGRGARVGS